jgi:sterol desaturase/sphingolipid hydroxylase (fatty acid hydroxylase superfamily)
MTLADRLLNFAQAFAVEQGKLLACAAVFIALAFIVKGGRAIQDGRGAAGQVRVNLIMSLVDQFTTTPLLGLAAAAIMAALHRSGLTLNTGPVWSFIGQWPTLLVCIFLGDFIGYWRHRLQHTDTFWPAHAVHHSDTHLTWFSLERMHPLDRLTSQGDTIILGLLGFPLWALAGNVFVRHYWGYFIHADVPWTLGKFSWVMNSPAMHRWHHVRDVDDHGSNFATVFSVFDRAFGTFRQPGPCDQPLGVREDMGRGALGQYLHPLKVFARHSAQRSSRTTVTA